MSIDIPLFKLQDAWRECERHVYHLIHALSAINRFSPMTGDGMDLLTDEQVQDIDQFILRYTKLQNTMVTRLFTSILNTIRTWFSNAYPMLELGKELPEMPGNRSGYGS